MSQITQFTISTLFTITLALALLYYFKRHMSVFCPLIPSSPPPEVKSSLPSSSFSGPLIAFENTYAYNTGIGTETKTLINPFTQDYA